MKGVENFPQHSACPFLPWHYAACMEPPGGNTPYSSSYLQIETKDFTMHSMHWLIGGLHKELVSVSPDSEHCPSWIQSLESAENRDEPDAIAAVLQADARWRKRSEQSRQVLGTSWAAWCRYSPAQSHKFDAQRLNEIFGFFICSKCTQMITCKLQWVAI